MGLKSDKGITTYVIGNNTLEDIINVYQNLPREIKIEKQKKQDEAMEALGPTKIDIESLRGGKRSKKNVHKRVSSVKHHSLKKNSRKKKRRTNFKKTLTRR